MKLLKYTLILLFSVGLMSCSGGDDEKEDNTNPIITLTSPTNSVLVNPGSILNVNAVLSDNVMLEDYAVKITAGGTKSVKNVEEFYFNSYTDSDAYGNALPEVSGRETATLNFDIAISDNARVGFYTFTLSAEDQSGNYTEEIVHFEITRP